MLWESKYGTGFDSKAGHVAYFGFRQVELMEKEMEKLEKLMIAEEQLKETEQEWVRLKEENLRIGQLTKEVDTLNEINKEKIDELVLLTNQNEELRWSNDYLRIELIKYQVLLKKIEESGISTIQNDDDVDNQLSELDNANNDNNEYKQVQDDFKGRKF